MPLLKIYLSDLLIPCNKCVLMDLSYDVNFENAKACKFCSLFPVYGANERMSSSLFLLRTLTDINKYNVFD